MSAALLSGATVTSARGIGCCNRLRWSNTRVAVPLCPRPSCRRTHCTQPLRCFASQNGPLDKAGPRAAAAAGAALLPLVSALAADASSAELAQLADIHALSPVKTVFAGLLIAMILLQGPKGDGMVNSLNESRMFGNFTETRNFVTIGIWGLVAGFIGLSALLALKV